MAHLYLAFFISSTGQVYDLSEHVRSVEWVDAEDNRVTVLVKLHNRCGEDAVGHLVGEVHEWQTFTLIYSSFEHAWNKRKARGVIVGVPMVDHEFEFMGKEWFGTYY